MSRGSERPTIPAAECPLEQSFEAEIERLSGGTWSERMKTAKPIVIEENES